MWDTFKFECLTVPAFKASMPDTSAFTCHPIELGSCTSCKEGGVGAGVVKVGRGVLRAVEPADAAGQAA